MLEQRMFRRAHHSADGGHGGMNAAAKLKCPGPPLPTLRAQVMPP